MIATALDNLAAPPCARLLGWHLLDARPKDGWIRIGFVGKPDFCNPAGFVQVLDEKTLVYPEYRGNGVLASLGNILENPHIGLMFPDFYQSTVGLHVNGTARVLNPSETESLARFFGQPRVTRW